MNDDETQQPTEVDRTLSGVPARIEASSELPSALAAPRPVAPAGWYPEQGSPGVSRWWDGYQWTDQRAATQAVTHQAPTPVSPYRSRNSMFLLALLLNGLAIQYFLTGRAGQGIGYLAVWWIGWMTTGLVIGWLLVLAGVIWWIVELCTVMAVTDRYNQRIAAGIAAL